MCLSLCRMCSHTQDHLLLLCFAGCRSMLQGVAVCCRVLQCVAVYCIALQCIAVCCSVSLCVVPCATSRTGHVAQFARLHTPDLNFFFERCPQLNAPCTRRAGKLWVQVFNRHAAELSRKSENWTFLHQKLIKQRLIHAASGMQKKRDVEHHYSLWFLVAYFLSFLLWWPRPNLITGLLTGSKHPWWSFWSRGLNHVE